MGVLHEYNNHCECGYVGLDSGVYCKSGHKWNMPSISMNLQNFLLKASDLIPNFFEIAMLNSQKFNEMIHEYRLSKTFVDECGGDITKAYCYDRFGGFLKENFKINELIDALNKHDDLRVLNKVGGNKYVLNDKFWNVDLSDSHGLTSNYYNIFKDRRFDEISAKVFTFIVVDMLFTRIIFSVRFASDACEDIGFYREYNLEDTENNKSKLKIIDDNFVFYLHKSSDACIKYLLKQYENNNHIDYEKYHNIKYNTCVGYNLEHYPLEFFFINSYLYNGYMDSNFVLIDILSIRKVWYLVILRYLRRYFIVYAIILIIFVVIIWGIVFNANTSENVVNDEKLDVDFNDSIKVSFP
jgi:hypothetical protein